MLVVNVDLWPESLPADVCESLRKSIYWIEPEITSVKITCGSRGTTAELQYEGRKTVKELQTRVVDQLQESIESALAFPSKLIYRGQHRSAKHPDPLTKLTELGFVYDEIVGVSLYSGVMAEVYRGIDRWLEQRFISLGSRPMIIPSLLSPATLIRTKYIESGAQNLNYVFRLREGSHVPRAVNTDALDFSDVASSSLHPETILTPAVCQVVYKALSDNELRNIQLLTGSARCFRYESGATESIRRSREFGVREFVCVGTEHEVKKCLEKLIDFAKEIIDSLKLDAQIVTASDPFFVEDYPSYRMYQISLDLKSEIQAKLPFDDSLIAISSINYHVAHFGAAWNITTPDGGYAHSCCMGFGLDRFCYALFSQFGTEPEYWPTHLKDIIGIPWENV